MISYLLLLALAAAGLISIAAVVNNNEIRAGRATQGGGVEVISVPPPAGSDTDALAKVILPASDAQAPPLEDCDQPYQSLGILPSYCNEGLSFPNPSSLSGSYRPQPLSGLALKLEQAVQAGKTLEEQMQSLWDGYCPVAKQYQLFDREELWGEAGGPDGQGLQSALQVHNTADYLYNKLVDQMPYSDIGQGIDPEMEKLLPKPFVVAAVEKCK